MKCVKRSLSKRIDKSYNDKFYSDNKKLMNILRDGEQYGKKQPHQEYAQAALKEFYKKLKSTSERKEYINRATHLSYMFLLVSVKHAFMKTDYIWACHELQDILHYEDIFQNRIKCNVLSLLEEYIETG